MDSGGREEVGDGAIRRSLKTFQLGDVEKRKPFRRSISESETKKSFRRRKIPLGRGPK